MEQIGNLDGLAQERPFWKRLHSTQQGNIVPRMIGIREGSGKEIDVSPPPDVPVD
jgi:hypothetical protein